MSATKIVFEDGTELEIPREVESEGKEAIDNYVEEHRPAPVSVEEAD